MSLENGSVQMLHLLQKYGLQYCSLNCHLQSILTVLKFLSVNERLRQSSLCKAKHFSPEFTSIPYHFCCFHNLEKRYLKLDVREHNEYQVANNFLSFALQAGFYYIILLDQSITRLRFITVFILAVSVIIVYGK